jgi:hypothetical protein
MLMAGEHPSALASNCASYSGAASLQILCKDATTAAYHRFLLQAGSVNFGLAAFAAVTDG